MLFFLMLVGASVWGQGCAGVTPPIITSSETWACGAANSATLSTSGALSYAWSTGATTTTMGNATVVQPGNYTVTATYANNCTATSTIGITAPPIAVSAGYSCQPHNGSPFILATIPIPGTLAWGGDFPYGAISGVNTSTQLSYLAKWLDNTTTYTATATYNCAGVNFSTTNTVTVYVFGGANGDGLWLSGTINGNNILPNTVNGGPNPNSPYHVCPNTPMHFEAESALGSVYNWTGFPQNHTNILNINAPSSPGTYDYTVSVDNPCNQGQTIYETISIIVDEMPDATITTDRISLPATLTVGSTSPQFSFEWSSIFAIGSNPATIANNAGVYTVTVTNVDNPACSATGSITIYGCGYPPPVSLNAPSTNWGNLFIDVDTYSVTDIDITSDVTLNNCTLTMAEGKRIFVKIGASLTLDNATITACDGYWLGIAVDGSPNGDIGTVGQQGRIFLKNNTTLEYAITAITTRRNEWIYTGGIVQADYTTFRNNMRDVEFMKARHKYQGNPIRNPSFFTQCTFVSDNTFGNAAHPFPVGVANMPHITMWDVHGVKIEDCIFQSDLSPTNPARYGETGIHSDGATYTATGNTFEGVYYGISAFNLKI
jgi:hypothetical protein